MRRTRLCTASDSEPKFRLRSIGSVVVMGAMVALGSLVLGTMSAAASESTQGHATALTSASSTDEQDAVASYQALQSNLYETSASCTRDCLRIPATPTRAFGRSRTRWPAPNSLDASPGGPSYASDVKARVNGLSGLHRSP